MAGRVTRRGRTAAALTLLLALLLPPPPASALERDENGIAILIAPADGRVVADLARAVAASGRFHLLSPGKIDIHAGEPLLLPEPPMTLHARDLWKAQTQARWLLVGSVHKVHSSADTAPAASSSAPISRVPHASRSVKVQRLAPSTLAYKLDMRVVDLDLGDSGPYFSETSSDRQALVKDALRFLRVHYPLRAEVSALSEDTLYLDVGTQDGISVGSRFVIERHPGTLNERIASVVVTDAADWFSACEVEDTTKGRSPQVGDVAIEDTSTFLTP